MSSIPLGQPDATYSGDPMASGLDEVRFRLGDTNVAQPLLTDGEIYFLLRQADDNPILAALRACDMIQAKLAGMVDESVGSVSIAFSQRRMGYVALAASLRALFAQGAKPFCGGISRSGKRSERSDTDRVQPSFTRDLMQREDTPEWHGPNGAYNTPARLRGEIY